MYSSLKDNFLWCSFWLITYSMVLFINDSLTENTAYPPCQAKHSYS